MWGFQCIQNLLINFSHVATSRIQLTWWCHLLLIHSCELYLLTLSWASIMIGISFGKLQLTLSDKNMDNSLQCNNQYYNSVSNHPNSYSIADRSPQQIGFLATNELHFFNTNVADPNSKSSLIPTSQEGENLVCSCLSSPQQLYADIALHLGHVTTVIHWLMRHWK